MYIHPSFLGMALEDNGLTEFPSESHRIVCERALLGNPDINSRDDLSRVAKKILDMSEEKVKTLTMKDVVDLMTDHQHEIIDQVQRSGMHTLLGIPDSH